MLPRVAETVALAVYRQGLAQSRDGGQGDGASRSPGAVRPIAGGGGVGRLAGGIVDDLDDPDEGGRAKKHRRGPLQNLDPLHVRQIEIGNRGIEGAAQGNAVDDQQEGVELMQAPE